MARAGAQSLPETRAAERMAEDAGATALRDAERALTGFEWGLWRLSAAFIRWQGECLSALAGRPLGGHDTALLHVVAYQGRPKGLSEIAKLLGRADLANIQYAIRKLNRLALIERVPGLSRKDTLYRVTPAGSGLTKAYRALRRELLVASAGISGENLADLEQRLAHLTGIYEDATRRAVRHQVSRASAAD